MASLAVERDPNGSDKSSSSLITMAGAIDYSKLRAQTLGSGLDEEAVTVNTRALIDKVLARYSGEWYGLHLRGQTRLGQTKLDQANTIPPTTLPLPSSQHPFFLIFFPSRRPEEEEGE